MDRIVFLIDQERGWASSMLRGEQLSRICELAPGLSRFRISVESEFARISNAMIFCTKSVLPVLSREVCRDLQSKGNKLVADPLDINTKGYDFSPFDAIAASSFLQEQFVLENFTGKPVFHVTHHVDLRIPAIAPQRHSFAAAYVGDVNNAFRLPDLQRRIAIVQSHATNMSWIHLLQRYNLHYGVREWKPWDGFKPFTKGFIAAHCEAPILVSREDQEALRQLGQDYPFKCHADLEDVNLALDFCSQSFGGDVWTQAMERMNRLKASSSLSAVSQQLQTLFLSFLG